MSYNDTFTHDLDFGEFGESLVAELLDNELTEVKSERADSVDEKGKWPTTRNHFVEYESRNKPSGIRTTKSKWWFVNFMIGKEIMFGKYISVERLKQKIVKLKPRRVRGGDNNTSWGFLFPIEEFDKL